MPLITGLKILKLVLKQIKLQIMREWGRDGGQNSCHLEPLTHCESLKCATKIGAEISWGSINAFHFLTERKGDTRIIYFKETPLDNSYESL